MNPYGPATSYTIRPDDGPQQCVIAVESLISFTNPARVDFDRAQPDQRAIWVLSWLVVGSSLSVLSILAARAFIAVKQDRRARAALWIYTPQLTTRAPDQIQGSGMGPRQGTQQPQSSTINANTQDQDPDAAKMSVTPGLAGTIPHAQRRYREAAKP